MDFNFDGICPPCWRLFTVPDMWVLASFVLDTSKPDVFLALGGSPGWERSFIASSSTYWFAQAKKGRPPAANSNSKATFK